jgi:hypothetical protein
MSEIVRISGDSMLAISYSQGHGELANSIIRPRVGIELMYSNNEFKHLKTIDIWLSHVPFSTN